MKRKTFHLLTYACVINSLVFTINVPAKCPPPQVYTTKIEGKDAAGIKTNLSRQTKKDIQKWDGYFQIVQVGETTEDDLFRWYVKLRMVSDLLGKKTYVYDYPFNLPESNQYHDIFNIRNSLAGSPNAPNQNQSGWKSTQSYYSEYEFIINESTQLVENKEKSLYFVKEENYHGKCEKPVIYFYPSKTQKTQVRLYYAGDITASYPPYDPLIHGWNIRAYPDGRLINLSDQEEYSYIFWEGSPLNLQYDLSEGFIVEGKKSDIFLRETLSKMGLTPREYNEFIVYWYPRLMKNTYNLIHFAHEQYEKIARLEVSPKPDSLLRVFMVYKPLAEKIKIKPQIIKPFVRSGFTVVEWGGTELTTDDLHS